MQQYDSLIANAELKFYLTEPPGAGNPGAVSLSQSSLALGYTRDFETSYLSDFDGIDRGYLKFAYFFAGRALLTLEGGAGAVEYPALYDLGGNPTQGHTPFTDMRVDATLFSEYRFTNWFGLNATLKYTTNLSDAVLNITPLPTPGQPNPQQLLAMQWQRWEAYLGVRFFL